MGFPLEFGSSNSNFCFDSNGNYIRPTLFDGSITITKETNTTEEPATTTVTATDTEETTTTEDCSTYIFDVNQDGYVNVVDLLVLKKRLLGMI
jgi:hypothetical protein